MEMSLQELGIMIKNKDTVSLNGKTEINMKDSGKIIKCMEQEQKHMQMVINMTVNGLMIKETDKVKLHGQMEINSLEVGKMMKYLERVY